MDISVITPIYYGNKYLNNYLKMMNKACNGNLNVEVLFINDSPEEKIEYDSSLIKNFKIRIIENERNSGIQKSRVNGLKNANGEYIIFLDQDDEISENCIRTQYELARGYDIVLGNGYYEDNTGMHKIYENNFSQRFAIKKKSMLEVRNFIISPGQCLIKKSSIPKYWIDNSLNINGADDYLLWLLMLNNAARINYNYDCVYIHSYTGKNLSLDNEKMYKSQLELLEKLDECNNYNRKSFKLLKRTIYFKYNYKKNFFTEVLKNIDIFMYNVYYRLVWRGYLASKNKAK